MKTVSSLWVCDYCGKEETSGEDRPDCWPQIEMLYKNGRYSGWLFTADLCRDCWSVLREHTAPAKKMKFDVWRALMTAWKKLMGGT
jgi:hypothetical protein